jgi:hypothetical protein
MATACTTLPRAGEIYRHFRGALYAVICLVDHSESGETLVLYQSLDSGHRWARPLAMWNELVEPSPGMLLPRFELLPEDLTVPVPLICKVVRAGKSSVELPERKA